MLLFEHRKGGVGWLISSLINVKYIVSLICLILERELVDLSTSSVAFS